MSAWDIIALPIAILLWIVVILALIGVGFLFLLIYGWLKG